MKSDALTSSHVQRAVQQEKRLNSKKGTKSGMGCAISKLMQRLFQEFEIRGFHFRSEELPAEIWSLSSTAIPTRARSSDVFDAVTGTARQTAQDSVCGIAPYRARSSLFTNGNKCGTSASRIPIGTFLTASRKVVRQPRSRVSSDTLVLASRDASIAL